MLTSEDITTLDKVQWLIRMMTHHRNLSPHWIEEHRMSAGRAALDLAIMQAMLDDYRNLLPRAQGGPSTPTPPPPAAA